MVNSSMGCGHHEASHRNPANLFCVRRLTVELERKLFMRSMAVVPCPVFNPALLKQ